MATYEVWSLKRGQKVHKAYEGPSEEAAGHAAGIIRLAGKSDPSVRIDGVLTITPDGERRQEIWRGSDGS